MANKEIEVVHKAVKETIELYPTAWYCKPAVCEGAGTAGNPDFIIHLNGVLIGCECKWSCHLKNGKITTDKSRLPNPQQTQKLREMKRSGALGIIIDKDHLDVFAKLMDVVSKTNSLSVLQSGVDGTGIDVEKYATELREVTV